MAREMLLVARASVLASLYGRDHPSVKARLARALWWQKRRPVGPDHHPYVVAWCRESGRAGHLNRGARRAAQRIVRALLADRPTRKMKKPLGVVLDIVYGRY